MADEAQTLNERLAAEIVRVLGDRERVAGMLAHELQEALDWVCGRRRGGARFFGGKARPVSGGEEMPSHGSPEVADALAYDFALDGLGEGEKARARMEGGEARGGNRVEEEGEEKDGRFQQCAEGAETKGVSVMLSNDLSNGLETGGISGGAASAAALKPSPSGGGGRGGGRAAPGGGLKWI